MRMDREAVEGPVVSGLSPQGFRVDDNIYRALTITPLRADGWEPPAIAALDLAALVPALGLDPQPEFLLLGTGAALVRPPVPLVRALDRRGIGVETMDSRAAASAWGVLRAEGRWIAGAFYPVAA